MNNKTQYHLKYKNIKPATIKTIKETIKAGLFKSENTEEFKQNLIINLNTQLCAVYDLEVNNIIFINTPFCVCNYNRITNNITLNKPSLISYLHEFKHYLDIKSIYHTTEENARGWSISAFYLATPKLCKSAIKKGFIMHQSKIIENNKKPSKTEERQKKDAVLRLTDNTLKVGLNNIIINFKEVF